jgi:endoglucanase
MFNLLKELTELTGPSGEEEAVQKRIKELWAPLSKTVRAYDNGNVVAEIGGTGPRLLLAAHADEISYMVRNISPDGFVWLSYGASSTDVRQLVANGLVGHPVLIKTVRGPVQGVLATVTGHAADRDKQITSFDDFYVDLGAASRKQVQALGVEIGNKVIFDVPTRRMGNYIVGKAMDDRAALVVLTALLQRIKPRKLAYTLLVASTVEEEIGTVGAAGLAGALDIDAMIALEIGLVGDTPLSNSRDYPARLGGGPIIVPRDGMTYYRTQLTNQLKAAAVRHKIPYQLSLFQRFGTDGRQFLLKGVASALVGFPTRYTHSAFEMICEKDLDNMVRLLECFVTTRPQRTTR